MRPGRRQSMVHVHVMHGRAADHRFAGRWDLLYRPDFVGDRGDVVEAVAKRIGVDRAVARLISSLRAEGLSNPHRCEMCARES